MTLSGEGDEFSNLEARHSLADFADNWVCSPRYLPTDLEPCTIHLSSVQRRWTAPRLTRVGSHWGGSVGSSLPATLLGDFTNPAPSRIVRSTSPTTTDVYLGTV